MEDCLSTSSVTIQKCCCHPPEQYLLELLCFLLHQESTFLRLSALCFSFLHKRFTSFNYALLFVLIQQNTVTLFSYSIRNYNAMTLEIRTKENL